MSEKNYKAIRKSAIKYALQEEQRIAQFMQDSIYHLTFPKRLIYALGVIFKWGNGGSRKQQHDGRNRMI